MGVTRGRMPGLARRAGSMYLPTTCDGLQWTCSRPVLQTGQNLAPLRSV